MGEPLEVRPLLQPRRVEELAPEAKSYKAYKVTFKKQEARRVVGVAFSPTSPHKLAVVSGTKVGLWQSAPSKDGNLEEVNSISKFKDLTQCAAWRDDGKLMLAGEASGSCAVIEMETRSILRRLRGHGDAVTCAAFAESDKSRVATGSRDGKLRLWDVATSELLHTVDAHTDSLKVLSAGPVGADSWITAGYDKCVKLWDARSPSKEGPDVEKAKAAISVSHGHPVEAGVAFPGAALFASAGGTSVKVWDLAMTGRTLHDLPDIHSKVVTGICLDSQASVLVTASFDGLSKVYHAATMSHVWTYRLPGPATCVAWRPDDSGFAIGLDDGNWLIRSRKAAAEKKPVASGKLVTPKQIHRVDGKGQHKEDDEWSDEPELQKSRKWKREEGHLRGHLHKPEEEDEVIERPQTRRKRESKVEYLFRKFEYRKVVELMLQPATDAALGFAIVDELLEQGALACAVNDLGEELCLEALRWLLKAFAEGDSLQRNLFNEFLHSLIDGNDCLKLPSNEKLVNTMHELDNKVQQELRVQEALFELTGTLETVFA
ncbi:UTP15 [Symbiodinium natans]|uniref:UTP15 protein n=1 Tax=Symbiodinium natans TaxID=878477 RepID=A0A812QSH7_9DINO|nr:UTP15 [Symbiodinium natans]